MYSLKMRAFYLSLLFCLVLFESPLFASTFFKKTKQKVGWHVKGRRIEEVEGKRRTRRNGRDGYRETDIET